MARAAIRMSARSATWVSCNYRQLGGLISPDANLVADARLTNPHIFPGGWRTRTVACANEPERSTSHDDQATPVREPAEQPAAVSAGRQQLHDGGSSPLSRRARMARPRR